MISQDKFKTIISTVGRIPIDKISDHSLLDSDLKLTSIDIVEIIFEVEQIGGVVFEINEIENYAKNMNKTLKQLTFLEFLNFLNNNV